MSESTNNPVEKKESSAVVEDIMGGAAESEPTPEVSELAAAAPTAEAMTTRVPLAEKAIVAKAEKAEYGPQDVVSPGQKDPDLMQVERQLEGRKMEARELWGLYFALTPAQREKFKSDGERLAMTFRGMLGRSDVQPADVFEPIRKWLSDVPGIIDPYVTQAAKIKADDVLKLIRERAETADTAI